MLKTSTLSEMGINNPGEIERYSLDTTNNIDVLRIVYKRTKGSLLPTSKRFEFGRSKRSIVSDSGSGKTETMHLISPFLQKAIAELDQIISAKTTYVEYAKLAREELQHLRKDMAIRINYIESLIDKL